MHQRFHLLVENRRCVDLGAKHTIERVHLLRACVHQRLLIDALPHVLVLLIGCLLWLQWLDSHRYVDLALDHPVLLFSLFEF